MNGHALSVMYDGEDIPAAQEHVCSSPRCHTAGIAKMGGDPNRAREDAYPTHLQFPSAQRRKDFHVASEPHDADWRSILTEYKQGGGQEHRCISCGRDIV